MIKIIEKISATIGYLIFGSSVLTYVSVLIKQPFEKMSTVGLSAFALVAAVSGLCFSMASVLEKENDKSTAIYSGEKFLHSTVLILETIVLKYASDTLLASQFMKAHELFSTIISWAAFALLLIISSYATYFYLYGFEALHDFLWNRFHVRRQNMHKKAHKTK